MNKQPVQITGSIHVSKPYDLILFNRNDRMVFQKGAVPLLQIGLAGRPRIQLLFCIISCVHTVNGLIKQRRELLTIGSLIFSKLHFSPSQIPDNTNACIASLLPLRRSRLGTGGAHFSVQITLLS